MEASILFNGTHIGVVPAFGLHGHGEDVVVWPIDSGFRSPRIITADVIPSMQLCLVHLTLFVDGFPSSFPLHQLSSCPLSQCNA